MLISKKDHNFPNVYFAGPLNALKKPAVGLLHKKWKRPEKNKNNHFSLVWEAAFLWLLVERNSTELHILSFIFVTTISYC